MTNTILAVILVPILLALASGEPATGEDWRLGVQAWSFHKYTFFEAVDKTESLGVRWIEAYPGQRLSPDLPDARFHHTMSEEHRGLVRAKLTKAGITLVNYGVVPLTGSEADNRKVFDFARDMGIETIVSEPEFDALPLVDRLCKEYRIHVALHNHPKPSRYWSPDIVLRSLEGRSDWIGACADTGHWMRSGVRPIDAVRKLEGRIVSFHLKDLGEFGNLKAHDVPWGTGEADLEAVCAELRRQKFHGVFSIEYEYNWEASVPEIAQCVTYFRKTAEEGIAGDR